MDDDLDFCLNELINDQGHEQDMVMGRMRQEQEDNESKFEMMACDAVDKVDRHEEEIRGKCFQIKGEINGHMRFLEKELMELLQQSATDASMQRLRGTTNIFDVLRRWRERDSSRAKFQDVIDQISHCCNDFYSHVGKTLTDCIYGRSCSVADDYNNELQQLIEHLLAFANDPEISLDKQSFVNHVYATRARLMRVMVDLRSLRDSAAHTHDLRRDAERVHDICQLSRREFELKHKAALSQHEAESMHLVSVLQILALASKNAGEFDKRRKQAEQRMLDDRRKFSTRKTPVIDGHIDTLSNNSLSMTVSFWNNDKLLKPEEWSISMSTIKKEFCSQICNHYQIDQSSNKFEVIKVVQENDHNNRDIFVVHTLVHPPHAETVTKELMTNDTRSYCLVQKLESTLKHAVRLITLGHFGMEVMNPKWNRIYGHVLGEPGSTFWSGPIDRGGKPYFCPKGWKRYSLKVADNEAEFDRLWGTWHIVYHGTKGEFVGAILQSGLKVSTSGCYLKRPSVYVSPSIEYCAHPRYSRIWQKPGSGKYHQLVFQCRVNPRVVSNKNVHPETLLRDKTVLIDPNFTNKELEWVIPSANREDEYITDDIVCYGLMIRSSDEHPDKLSSSHWWSVSHCWP